MAHAWLLVVTAYGFGVSWGTRSQSARQQSRHGSCYSNVTPQAISRRATYHNRIMKLRQKMATILQTYQLPILNSVRTSSSAFSSQILASRKIKSSSAQPASSRTRFRASLSLLDKSSTTTTCRANGHHYNLQTYFCLSTCGAHL